MQAKFYRYLIFSALLCLLGMANALGQNTADSLRERISVQQGAARQQAMMELMKFYMGESLEKSLQTAKELRAELRKSPNQSIECELCEILGEIYYHLGNYSLAIENNLSAIEICRKTGQNRLLSDAFHNSGVIYEYLGIYDKALESYFDALEVCKQMKDSSEIAFTLTSIGGFYNRVGKKEEALQYLRQADALYRQQKKSERGWVKANIAQVFSKDEDYQQAIIHFEEALTIYQQEKDKTTLPPLLTAMANTYQEVGETDKAQQFYEQSIEQAQSIGATNYMPANFIGLSGIASQKGQHTEAVGYLRKAQDFAEKNQALSHLQTIYSKLSALYEKQGNIEQALVFHKKLDRVNDSVYTKEFARKAAEIETLYKMQDRQRENQLLAVTNEKQRTEISKQKNRQYALIAIVVLIVALIVVVHLRYLNNKKSNRLLRAQNAKINEQKEELTQLLNQLTESEISNTALIENSPLGIVVLSPHGKILRANPSVALLLVANSAQEMLDSNLFRFAPFEEAGINSKIREALQRKQTLISEHIYPLPKGEKKNLQLHIAPVFSVEKEVMAVQVIIQDISERKLWEKQLLESENRYRTIFETTRNATVILEEDTTILLSNKQFEKLSGFSKQELEGKISWTRFVHPDDLQTMKERHQKRRHEPGKIQRHYEFRFLDRHKQEIPILLAVDVIPGTRQSVASLMDLTEVKLSQIKIRESENRYRAIFETTVNATAIIDKNSMVILANRVFEELSGFSKQELENKKSWLDFVAPHDRKRLKQFNQLRLEQKPEAPKSYEFEFVSREHKIHHILMAVDLIPGTQNSVASLSDISRRKASERNLQRSEHRFRKFFELGLIGMAMGTPQKQWIAVNDHLCEMLGFARQEVVNKKWTDFTHPDDLPENEDLFEKMLNGEIDNYKTEKRYIKKGGEVIFASISVNCVRDQHNKIENIIAHIQDITEQKKYERKLLESQNELQKLNATKDKMFSIIGHDLRGPIGNFRSMIEMLSEDPEGFDKESLMEIYSTLREAADTTFNLLENLLYWARSQRDEMAFEPEKANLKEIIDENISLHREGARIKGIELRSNLDKPVHIFADKNMVTTVIRNLISNAIKFTPGMGKVTVSAHKQGDQVKICVKDTGIGIKKDSIEKIFSTNFHFTTRGTNKEAGSGLGLVLSKEFVEKNGGKMQIDSTPGKGSVFSFTVRAFNS